MEKVIKEKVEELVELMNDPEITVIEKEVREKLEIILALLNDPEEIVVKEKEVKEKLKKIVALVNNAMVDPDIDIDYCIPGVETTLKNCDDVDYPYILVTYVVSEYTKPTHRIPLLGNMAGLHGTPEEIAKQVTFFIEEFKGEIDSVEMG